MFGDRVTGSKNAALFQMLSHPPFSVHQTGSAKAPPSLQPADCVREALRAGDGEWDSRGISLWAPQAAPLNSDITSLTTARIDVRLQNPSGLYEGLGSLPVA